MRVFIQKGEQFADCLVAVKAVGVQLGFIGSGEICNDND